MRVSVWNDAHLTPAQKQMARDRAFGRAIEKAMKDLLARVDEANNNGLMVSASIATDRNFRGALRVSRYQKDKPIRVLDIPEIP